MDLELVRDHVEVVPVPLELHMPLRLDWSGRLASPNSLQRQQRPLHGSSQDLEYPTPCVVRRMADHPPNHHKNLMSRLQISHSGGAQGRERYGRTSRPKW
jgi:hypothetical protein